MSDFSSDSDAEIDSIDQQFSAAADHIQHTHEAYTPNALLELYALYKQATVGRCNSQKPGLFSLQARSKWTAWNDLGDMPKKTAKENYVKKVQHLDPKWNEKLQNEIKRNTASWVVHSVHAPSDSEEHEQRSENEKTCFDHVKESNLERLRAELKQEHLKALDENGLGLIHWATDRNSIEILEYLITAGIDVNMPDADSQTALHYAASCGHIESLRLLLHYKANKSSKDADGQTCIDVAESIEIRELLEKS